MYYNVLICYHKLFRLSIRRRQSAYNVLLRRHRRVLCFLPTIGKALDNGVKVRIAEESDGLALWRNAFHVADFLCGRSDDSVECRSEYVVAPA